MDGSYSGLVWRTYNPFTKVQIFLHPPLSGCSSVGRARVLGTRGRESEPPHSDHEGLSSILYLHFHKRKESTNMPSVSYRLRWGCCNIQKVSNDLNREWLDSPPIEGESAGRFVHNTRHQNIRAYGMVTTWDLFWGRKVPACRYRDYLP